MRTADMPPVSGARSTEWQDPGGSLVVLAMPLAFHPRVPMQGRLPIIQNFLLRIRQSHLACADQALQFALDAVFAFRFANRLLSQISEFSWVTAKTEREGVI